MSDHRPVPDGALPAGSPPADYPSGPPLAPPPSPVPAGALRPPTGWPGGQPEEPAPARRPRRGWVVAVAVLAAASLLLAGVAAYVQSDLGDRAALGGSSGPLPGAPEDPPALPLPTPPADLDTVVADIQDFVAAERGLPFVRDVEVELAGDAEFEARLLEDFDAHAEDTATAGRVLAALGLVAPGTDVVAALRSLVAASAVGFYDPRTDELVVRGRQPTPFVRAVIAHELTHALDDQYFELHRPALDEAGDESAFAFDALAEGDAVRVEEAYRATFTGEEERQALLEELSAFDVGAVSDVPPALVQQLYASYELGADLVDAVLDAGGQDRLDDAFDRPPTTSEHLLDPDTFLAGEAAVAVPPVPADGPVIDEGVLGALGLAQLLQGGDGLTLGVPDGGDAVEGWGGDRYVAWERPGGGTCLRAVVVGDSPDDTAELADALGAWADDPPEAVDAEVTAAADRSAVTLTSCSA